MSNLRSTPLRNARTNRHDCTVPNLQRSRHYSNPIYLNATTPGFAAASTASTGSARRGDQAHEDSSEEEIELEHDHHNRRDCYWRVVRLQLV
jgi:hypothetical protein